MGPVRPAVSSRTEGDYYLGRYPEALAAFERAREARPDWYALHDGIGWCYLKLGQKAAAGGAFEKALALRPGYDDALEGLRQARSSTVYGTRVVNVGAMVWAILTLVIGGPGLRLTTAAPGTSVRFVGEVARGQTFEQELTGGLVFRLVPDEYGWTIWIGTRSRPDHDFSAVVTPPFRGMNHRYIEGWHFRNADNSGPNEPGPKNVNAPQKLREFAFVTRAEDYRIASGALDKLLWPSTEAEREAAWQRFDAAERKAARGRLTILDLALGNLTAGQRAWVDRMKFEVEPALP